MNQLISIALVTLGLVLFIAPDYLLSKDTSNSTLKMAYDYHQVIGVACIFSAYYLYPSSEESQLLDKTTTSTDVSSSQELPSYEQATES